MEDRAAFGRELMLQHDPSPQGPVACDGATVVKDLRLLDAFVASIAAGKIP
jgi:hypothetical protein